MMKNLWSIMEVWLNLSNIYGLEGFANYEMCEAGVLRNVETKRILKESINGKGYVTFRLSQGGITKLVYKHRLMAELWIWNPDKKPCVDHQDQNKLNNSIENLRWATRSENNRNVSRQKKNKSGEHNIHLHTVGELKYWQVHFGGGKYGNRHCKYFIRDPNSDVIPDEVLQYRDQYSKQWKGEFNPE